MTGNELVAEPDVTVSGQITVSGRRSARRDLPDSPFVAAATGRRPNRRPVWFMRQAGRSLPEYRQIRAGIGMLDSCFNPELVAEITLQPVRRHGVDAAILFSDIVVPLKAAGIGVDIVAGVGPVVADPVRTISDVERLPQLAPEQVEQISAAVRLLVAELGPTALIGFAGAPFTLASYLIEGGPSKSHSRTKALMHAEPQVWHRLLDHLAGLTGVFLSAQIEAGVDAVQLFDSWAGALTLADYRALVQPHSAAVFERIAGADLPKFHFGVGTGELLGAMGAAGADVVGVDWRIPLDEAGRRVGPGKGLQGNLDPATLFAGEAVVRAELRRIAAEADRALAAGTTGHVFNLGHGVLPDTDPGAITAAVAFIHDGLAVPENPAR